MSALANALVAVVALEHLWFLALEMFLWTKPLGLKTFRQSEEKARAPPPSPRIRPLQRLPGRGARGPRRPAAGVRVLIKVFFLACVDRGVFGHAPFRRASSSCRPCPRPWPCCSCSRAANWPRSARRGRQPSVPLQDSRRRSCGRASTVRPRSPVIVRAATSALTIASSVAPTVASKSGSMRSLGSMVSAGTPSLSPACGLAVEKARKRSPDPLPATAPVRARPSAARRARRSS